MEIVIKILQFVAALSLLVLVHELGHFLFAKLFKCRVEKFYIFFNPWFTPFKFKIGETEYGIGWLPLGGYCKIAGMVDESMDTDSLKEPPKSYEFRSKPAWQRLFIMVGGVLMNIILAIVVYTGMSMHWGDAYHATEDINNAYGFEFSELGRQVGFQNGDKVISVDGRQIENSAEINYALLLDGVENVRVERAGQIVDVPMYPQYIASMLSAEEVFVRPLNPLIVEGIVPGGGADAARLQPGDRLLTLNGEPVSHNNNLIPRHPGETVELAVARDSAGVTRTLTLPVAVSDEGMLGIELAQIALPVSAKTYGFFEAIPQGFKRAKTEVGKYLKQIKLIFTPQTEAYKQVGGIIAIGRIFPGQWDWYFFWNITAMLSIMLAVVNLLPIPGLDGGHVLFVLYEMITRRKPSDKFMEAATWVGLIFILFLLIYANGSDVVRLFNK